MNRKTSGILVLDARIRVLFAALLSVLSVILRENGYLLLFTGMTCVIMLLSGVIKPALTQSALIILCCLLQLVLGDWFTGTTRIFVMTVMQILPRMMFLGMLGCP